MECKMRGTICVMVSHGTPCLGPHQAKVQRETGRKFSALCEFWDHSVPRQPKRYYNKKD